MAVDGEQLRLTPPAVLIAATQAIAADLVVEALLRIGASKREDAGLHMAHGLIGMIRAGLEASAGEPETMPPRMGGAGHA